ncbi:hypothetical protein GF325_18190 [Candidatus Bathyarchaeota archaeon]|nr:hypothetical protein [Candidatus Bathyarchaeota archaeon]
MIPTISAKNLPIGKEEYSLLDRNFNGGISWSENTMNYALCWDWSNSTNHELFLGIISKESFEVEKTFILDVNRTISVPMNYIEQKDPSIVLLENGTIILFFNMRFEATPHTYMYCMKTNDNGSSWSAPEIISDSSLYAFRNTYLVKINETTLFAIWEQRNSSVSSLNYSLYYRISQDGGTTWDPEVLFMENITSYYSFERLDNGSIAMAIVFNDHAEGLYEPYQFHEFIVPENLSSLPSTTINMVSNITMSTDFNYLIFDDGEYLINTGNTFTYHDLVRNKTSLEYTFPISDGLAPGNPILSLEKIDSTNYLIFYKVYDPVSLTYSGLNYMFGNDFNWLKDAQGIEDMILFMALLGVIIGGQIVLYFVYRYYKNRKTKAPIDPASSDDSKSRNTVQGDHPESKE